MNDTVAPAIEHTAGAAASIVNVTGKTRGRGRRHGVGRAAHRRADGAVEVKLIVCVPLPTANDCCTCGAAL